MGIARSSVLVAGGAGYIGSHAVLALMEAGYDVTIVDNLSTGSIASVPDRARFVEGDLSDETLVAGLFNQERFDAVMHFAASTVAPASVTDPFTFYRNNTANTIRLGTRAARANVRAFVFSSTAAVYGSCGIGPVDEGAPTCPQSPYGWSKLMSEQILRDMSAASQFRLGVLRYFNVAGADPLFRTGQRTPNATHLIKVACEHAVGKRESVTVFGADFDTPDGTGVRDYVHVSDLADAHVAAVSHLLAGGDGFVLNCGYGRGFSVLDVACALERVSARRLCLRYADRRPGDPAVSIANADRLRRTLNWTPRFDDLEAIVATALEWERRLGQPDRSQQIMPTEVRLRTPSRREVPEFSARQGDSL